MSFTSDVSNGVGLEIVVLLKNKCGNLIFFFNWHLAQHIYSLPVFRRIYLLVVVFYTLDLNRENILIFLLIKTLLHLVNLHV